MLKYCIKLTITCLLVGMFSPLPQMRAQSNIEIIKKDTLAVDTGLIDNTGSYSQPRAVVVAPIFLDNDVELSAKDWYRGLFYYFSSDRYFFKDIPVHYVMDRDGNVYQGIEGGTARKVVVTDAPAAPVVIFYLAQRGETNFSLSGEAKLKSFILQIANDNEIDPDNIEVGGMALKIDEEKKEAALAKEEIFGSWVVTMKDIREYVKKKYDPAQKEYSVNVSEFNNPNGKVKVGSQVVLKLELENTGDDAIFPESNNSLLFVKADDKDSEFFVNSIWVSKTQLPILSEDDLLLPGEKKTFDLKINVPFRPGTYSEDFVIKTVGGQTIKDSKVTVKLEIERGDLKLLEILDTETGTLNVRQTPGAGAPLVGKVSPGERYVWLQKDDSGWYQIQLDDGKGWILGKYAKVL